MNIYLIAIAVLPVLVLAFVVYRQDKYEKEPLGKLIKAFIFGALAIIPAGLMESILIRFVPPIPIVSGAYTGFVVAGCSEELCKLLLLRWAIWKSREFNEYFDGIVYATFVSLGFACFENLGYVLGQEVFAEAMATGTMRAFLSVPGHFLFGVMMGYYF
jgi:RsiW-degrading membrane proteinase PrsW (M82 family)